MATYNFTIEDDRGELGSTALPNPPGVSHDQMVPLLEEQLEVGKREVVTGAVVLRKHTEERTETIDVPLTRVQWKVEHVPIDRVVSEHPTVRREGDTTVYPVIEERLIVTRELVLVEEVRLTPITTTTQERADYVLRREQITEEREAMTQITSE